MAKLPPNVTGIFNQDIVLGVGNLTIYNSGGSVFATFTETDIIIDANKFTIDISTLPFVNGSYYVNITAGLFNSIAGQTVSINDETTWTFNIVDGEFDPAEFDNNEFLTI